MGTRSLTFVYDNGKEILNMYRQYDGYPTGHGAELAEFLGAGRLVNGIPSDAKGIVFNGMGCLAAQMVAHFKTDSGGIYLESVDSKDCGQDYEYHVSLVDDALNIKVINCGCNFFGMTQSETKEVIFNGNLDKFAEFCSEEETV